MTGKDLLVALSHVDRKYVQEAEFAFLQKGNRPVRKLLLEIALALAVAGASYFFLKRLGVI